MTPTPLSDLHAALAKIERHMTAERLNEIANHESVYPFVRGAAEGPLDLSAIVANPQNVCLVGDHGAELFVKLQPGLYEVHSQCLPDGRGAWMLRFVRAAIHWMFCHTDAVELLTRCPTLAAKALARGIGGTREFTNAQGWILDGRTVPADVYSLTIQSWMRTAPGLEERGRWFHERLEAEFARHGKAEEAHEDDETHNRAVGLACEMMLGGQPEKAIIFYERIAVLANYGPVSVVTTDPLTIDIGTALIIVGRDGNFWAPVVRDKAA